MTYVTGRIVTKCCLMCPTNTCDLGQYLCSRYHDIRTIGGKVIRTIMKLVSADWIVTDACCYLTNEQLSS